MSVDIRLPNINNNASEREQLIQVRSYLYQLAEQLQFTLNNLSPTSSNVVVQTQKAGSAKPTSAIDGQATFDALKPLIIKSADIVEAFYTSISEKLEEYYYAKSDFGTYSQKTSQEISANSEYIKQLFDSKETIETNIGEISAYLVDVDAYIKSGKIDTRTDESGNEFPVYGVEVGATREVDGEEVFSKFARFTSDRLEFYDKYSKDPVAYISDYKLYITNVEITGTARLGAFQLDLSRGLTLKWVGRG